MTRYQDPDNQAGPVTTTWHTNSLGRLTVQEKKPGVAPQTPRFRQLGRGSAGAVVQRFGHRLLPPWPGSRLSHPVRRDGPGDAPRRQGRRPNRAGDHDNFSYDANSSAIEGVPRNTLERPAIGVVVKSLTVSGTVWPPALSSRCVTRPIASYWMRETRSWPGGQGRPHIVAPLHLRDVAPAIENAGLWRRARLVLAWSPSRANRCARSWSPDPPGCRGPCSVSCWSYCPAHRS